jgi:Restriction endonuclease
MSRQRPRVKFDGILIAIMTMLVLGGLVALGFLRDVSRENRALVVIAISLGLIGCFAGLLFLGAFRRWLRKRVWVRAMTVWNESSQASQTPKFILTENLSDSELRQLAIRIYSRMGYRVPNKAGEEGYLRLINPEGRVELIACQHQPDLIKLHHVYSLELEMKRTKAVRGFFWAPAGFTSEASEWAVHRPIILTDRHEIGRLVDCAQANGSHFLENL